MRSIIFIFFIIFAINLKKVYFKKRREERKYKPIKKYQNINLGSSHSKFAFSTHKNRNILNLAIESQTFYFDYLMLEKYYDYIDKNGIAFIGVSYFSFAAKKVWQETELEKYFYLFDKKNFEEYKVKYYIYKYFPILKEIPILKKYIKLKSPRKIEQDKRADGHIKKLKDKRYRENNIKLLKKIIEKCQLKAMRVILFTTPFRKEYNDYCTKEDLDENFYKIINNILKEYNIEYLDFSHDYQVFTEEDFIENDYDHLSEKGSIKFMKELEKKLGRKF